MFNFYINSIAWICRCVWRFILSICNVFFTFFRIKFIYFYFFYDAVFRPDDASTECGRVFFFYIRFIFIYIKFSGTLIMYVEAVFFFCGYLFFLIWGTCGAVILYILGIQHWWCRFCQFLSVHMNLNSSVNVLSLFI